MTSEVVPRWRRWASRLKAEVFALYLACRHPDVPWYAKVAAACVVAYALSPIDLIPDFIPVIGHLDDLILVPLGIAIVIRLIPDEVLAECRERARTSLEEGRRMGWVAGIFISLVWLIAILLVTSILLRYVDLSL